MIYRIAQILFLSALVFACSAVLSPTEKDSDRYRQDKTYDSLERISKNLSKGMHRHEVERLLGEPDYSPIIGQYYYSSDGSVYSEDQEREIAVGLIVDYRERNGEITETLQEFHLGPIGE